MNIIKMISKKNCYIGQNRPAYIVIHETDNWSKGADAKAHANAMKNGNLAGTVHYYQNPYIRRWTTATGPGQ